MGTPSDGYARAWQSGAVDTHGMGYSTPVEGRFGWTARHSRTRVCVRLCYSSAALGSLWMGTRSRIQSALLASRVRIFSLSPRQMGTRALAYCDPSRTHTHTQCC